MNTIVGFIFNFLPNNRFKNYDKQLKNNTIIPMLNVQNSGS